MLPWPHKLWPWLLLWQCRAGDLLTNWTEGENDRYKLSNLAKNIFWDRDKRFVLCGLQHFALFHLKLVVRWIFNNWCRKSPMVTYVTWTWSGKGPKAGKLDDTNYNNVDNENGCWILYKHRHKRQWSIWFGDTMDISPWSNKYSSELTGILFEEHLSRKYRLA